MIKTQRVWPRYKTNVIDAFTFQLEDLAIKIAIAGNTNNKKYVIGSGLAVEFYNGRLSRNHHDIDFHPLHADVPWWLKWFKDLGYTVLEKQNKKVGMVYEVKSSSNELLVDLWPIAKNVNWEDGNVKVVNYKNIKMIIEDPNIVLVSKLRYTREHCKGKLRVQDLHDFAIMGKDPTDL